MIWCPDTFQKMQASDLGLCVIFVRKYQFFNAAFDRYIYVKILFFLQCFPVLPSKYLYETESK